MVMKKYKTTSKFHRRIVRKGDLEGRAAFGFSSMFYKNDGSKSGIHFFQFPKINPEKLPLCQLVKRRDICDGFKANNFTFICEKHFPDDAIKTNPITWKLNRGSAPSLNFPQSLNRKTTSRKEPVTRSIDSSIYVSPIHHQYHSLTFQ